MNAPHFSTLFAAALLFGPVAQAAEADGIAFFESKIRPLLDALDANHFRISDALRAEALRFAGE